MFTRVTKYLFPLVFVSLLIILTPEVFAATTRTINVDNVDDNNPVGGCTLREAIDLANTGAGSGPAANGCTVIESGTGSPVAYQINLPAYTYTLTGAFGEDNNASGDLDIRANLTLTGLGPGNTIIDGADTDRSFHIPVDNLRVTISGLTIRNGFLPNVTFPGGSGGGIANISTSIVDIINCTIRDNIVNGTGGGVFNFLGTTTISNSLITNNQATPGVTNAGGGVVNQGSTMYILSSVISNNRATGSCCGGVYNVGGATLTMIHSSVISNVAGRTGIFGGGGILNESSTANIANSTISGNSANVNGGGIYQRSVPSAATINLTNVTLTNNTADADNNGSGDGGGIYNESGAFNLKSTIIAQNIDTGGQNPDIVTTITSRGYNLIGTVGTTNFASNTTGDQYGDPNNTTIASAGAQESATAINPMLGGLTSNPAYHPLLAGSPAIDKIPSQSCTFISTGSNPLFNNGDPNTRDQAGIFRPQQLVCDQGAVEFIVPTDLKVSKTVVPALVSPGDLLTYTLIFTNTGPGLATDVIIADQIPLTLTNVSVISSGAVITDTGTLPKFRWQVQPLAQNQSGIITLTGRVNSLLKAVSRFSNTVTLSTTTVETNTTNNTATAGVEVALANLSLTKTVSPTGVIAYRGAVTYTVVLKNNGQISATPVLLTDTLPANTTFARWVTKPAGTTVNNNRLTWSGKVLPTQAVTFRFVVTHTGNYGETVTNTVTYDYQGQRSSQSAGFKVVSAPRGPLGGVFLPLITKQPLAFPDLVIKSLVATKDSNFIVTIKNTGDAPVREVFWVDLYVNPQPVPTRVDQHWKQIAEEGLVWIVTKPLGVNEELTLTVADPYFSGVNSQVSGFLSAGTPIYAQVDSIKLNGNFGGVLEYHEFVGGSYNNIASTLVK